MALDPSSILSRSIELTWRIAAQSLRHVPLRVSQTLNSYFMRPMITARHRVQTDIYLLAAERRENPSTAMRRDSSRLHPSLGIANPLALTAPNIDGAMQIRFNRRIIGNVKTAVNSLRLVPF
jgi:hypothetical protein